MKKSEESVFLDRNKKSVGNHTLHMEVSVVVAYFFVSSSSSRFCRLYTGRYPGLKNENDLSTSELPSGLLESRDSRDEMKKFDNSWDRPHFEEPEEFTSFYDLGCGCYPQGQLMYFNTAVSSSPGASEDRSFLRVNTIVNH